MERTELILVDANDKETGSCEKMEAHQKGLLHRAFSIFIFDRKGEMLLQQRAVDKYHSGGLWTNACCSHPGPRENTMISAGNRLNDELGFRTELEKVFDFVYRAEFSNGLIEHEFDHVYAGEYQDSIPFNRNEVAGICYKSMSEIKQDLLDRPEIYTVWFRLAFEKINHWWEQRYGFDKLSLTN